MDPKYYPIEKEKHLPNLHCRGCKRSSSANPRKTTMKKHNQKLESFSAPLANQGAI